MKHSIVSILLIMMTIVTTSLAANGNTLYGKPTVIVAQPQIATRNAPVRVSVPRIQKPKIFRSNPHRAVHYALNANQSDDIGIDDDDKITGYRREDLQRLKTDPTLKNPEGLSEDIQWKLFLARQLALLKYKEIHS